MDSVGIGIQNVNQNQMHNQVHIYNNHRQGRHVFPAVSSLILPGTGQMLNGKHIEGTVRLVGEAGLLAALGGLVFRIRKNTALIKKPAKGLFAKVETAAKYIITAASKNKIKAVAAAVLLIGLISAHINGFVDAYRHGIEETGKNS